MCIVQYPPSPFRISSNILQPPWGSGRRLKPLAAWRPAHRTPWRRWRWSPPWHTHTWPASSRFIANQVARYLDLWKKTVSQWAWDIESQLIVESKIDVLPGLDSRTHISYPYHSSPAHLFIMWSSRLVPQKATRSTIPWRKRSSTVVMFPKRRRILEGNTRVFFF